MKKMKKILTSVFLLVAFFATTAFAQKGDITIGAGIDVGLPIGDFGEGYGVGIGATAKGMYGLSDAGQATLTLGFIRFGLKDTPDGMSGSAGLIPVLAGYRHRFDDLYAEGQIGLTVVRSSVTVKGLEGIPGLGSIGGSSSKTNFGYAFGGGYLFNNWDLGLRFQGVSGEGGSLNFVALRVGYNFAL